MWNQRNERWGRGKKSDREAGRKRAIVSQF